MKELLGEQFCENLLFMHAFLGCDTTSRTFSIGKGVIVKKFKEENSLYLCAEIFNNMESSVESIIRFGEKILVSLIGGKEDDTLDQLRLSKFHKKIATSATAVSPHLIPPTSNALRVFHTIQIWEGDTDMQPEDFGWKIVDGKLTPVMMTNPIAPDCLLNIFKCGCKGDCCTKRCSCFKNDLECSSAECRGMACLNSPHIDEEIDCVDEETGDI